MECNFGGPAQFEMRLIFDDSPCPTHASIIMPNGLERLKAAHELLIQLLKDANELGYEVKIRCKETEFTSRHFVHPKTISRIGEGLQSS